MEATMGIRDIDEPGFQKKEWLVQRIAWILLGILLVGAFLGIFGAGPLSENTEEAADGSLTVEYERFTRHVGMTTATFSIGQPAISGGKATLYISRDLAEGWRIVNVSPQPSTESSSADWLIYEFDVLGDDPPRVKLQYRGDGFGPHEGYVRAGESSVPVSIWQWIHP